MKVTKAQITDWKQKWGSVHEVKVPLNDGGTKTGTGYFRKPDLNVISAASKFAESDPVKSGEIMFNTCWLGGDEELQQNDEAKMSCIQKLGGLFKVREATIKEL